VAPLKNQRAELFCQFVAKGEPDGRAYAAAGYRPDPGHASRLASNGKVKQRIAELQSKAAARVEITAAKLLADLESIKAQAQKAGQLSAAARATEIQAKLAGLMVERREVSQTKTSGPELDLNKLTDADWTVLESLRPVFERARIKPQTEH
jgi:phage terminase small subunit